MRKFFSAIAAFTAVCTLLTGCGGVDSSFSSDYVTGVLDASYKGDFDYYLYSTGSDETAAQEMYDSTIKYYADSIAFYCEVDLDNVEAGVVDEYTEFSRELLSKAKYTVSSAENGKDSCYVTVSIKPIDILAQMETGIQTCIDEYNANVEDLVSEMGNEAIENMSDEEYAQFEAELENSYALSILDALRTCSDSLKYKDNVDFTIEIIIDENDTYAPANENDWNTIDDYIMGLY